MNNEFQLLSLLLILAVDAVALFHLFRWNKSSTNVKSLWALIIILLPLIGISLYYFNIMASKNKIGRE